MARRSCLRRTQELPLNTRWKVREGGRGQGGFPPNRPTRRPAEGLRELRPSPDPPEGRGKGGRPQLQGGRAQAGVGSYPVHLAFASLKRGEISSHTPPRPACMSSRSRHGEGPRQGWGARGLCPSSGKEWGWRGGPPSSSVSSPAGLTQRETEAWRGAEPPQGPGEVQGQNSCLDPVHPNPLRALPSTIRGPTGRREAVSGAGPCVGQHCPLPASPRTTFPFNIKHQATCQARRPWAPAPSPGAARQEPGGSGCTRAATGCVELLQGLLEEEALELCLGGSWGLAAPRASLSSEQKQRHAPHRPPAPGRSALSPSHQAWARTSSPPAGAWRSQRGRTPRGHRHGGWLRARRGSSASTSSSPSSQGPPARNTGGHPQERTWPY